MEIEVDRTFDLEQIEKSGQCFRWHKTEQGYTIVAFDKVLIAKQEEGKLILDCSRDEFEKLWRDYFDLDRDYESILNKADDSFLKLCCDHSCGIRILKQDPWEIIVTFSIAQQKSLSQIKKIIDRFCRSFGQKIDDKHYTFPKPEDFPDDLDGFGLGYRQKYLENTIKRFKEDKTLLDRLKTMDEEELFGELKSFYGIGDKIANCIMLYGFHKLDRFPVDVWVKRALENEYKDGFDHGKYHPYNGIYQQYIFHYSRLHPELVNN